MAHLRSPCARCPRPHSARGYCRVCLNNWQQGNIKEPPPGEPALATCECCHARFAVGPLTMVCSVCYDDLSARVARAREFRDPVPARA